MGIKKKMERYGDRQFSITISLEKGRHEFKIGSDDFHAIDLRAMPDEISPPINTAIKLAP